MLCYTFLISFRVHWGGIRYEPRPLTIVTHKKRVYVAFMALLIAFLRFSVNFSHYREIDLKKEILHFELDSNFSTFLFSVCVEKSVKRRKKRIDLCL